MCLLVMRHIRSSLVFIGYENDTISFNGLKGIEPELRGFHTKNCCKREINIRQMNSQTVER